MKKEMWKDLGDFTQIRKENGGRIGEPLIKSYNKKILWTVNHRMNSLINKLYHKSWGESVMKRIKKVFI